MNPRRLPLLLLAGVVLLAGLVVIGRSAVLADPGADIVAWWSMDETSGNRADSTGSYDLTDVNTVGYTSGLVGNAASFDSSNSEYFSSSFAGCTGDNDFSVVGWLYSTDITKISQILYDYAVAPNRTMFFRQQSTGSLLFSVSADGTTVTNRGFGSLSVNTWHFFFIYHDAAADEIGASLDDGSITTSSHSGGCHDNSLDITVSDGSAVGWDGYLDEIVWYDQVLSSADVTYLYNSGAGRAYADVAATPTPTPTITSTPTETPTPTNTPTPGALVYSVPLPSGGNGQVEMSASAGELIAGSVGILLAALVIFYLVRDMAFMGVKK